MGRIVAFLTLLSSFMRTGALRFFVKPFYDFLMFFTLQSQTL